jgi:hypothetical protein
VTDAWIKKEYTVTKLFSSKPDAPALFIKDISESIHSNPLIGDIMGHTGGLPCVPNIIAGCLLFLLFNHASLLLEKTSIKDLMR